MNTNEETKYMNSENENQDVVEENVENVENSKGETWKSVTIGGVTGILMGAGGLYALNAVAANGEPEKPIVPGAVKTNDVTGIKVAQVTDEMSFGEAFATARQAVGGGGGVFHWRGNVYNTFTKEEWNAMTPAERNEFAREAQPEITAEANLHPHRVNTHHDVADNDHNNTGGQKVKEHENTAKGGKTQENEEIAKGGGKKTADDDDIKGDYPNDDDIHVVGRDEVDGHSVAFVDITGNGETDVAIIDVDNDKQLSEADILIDNEGNAMTLGGEIVSTSETGYTQDDYDAGNDGTLDLMSL